MVKLKTIQAAMRAAMTRGVDPRNSHEVQAEMLQRHWKMDAGRRAMTRSEAVANHGLAMILRARRQAG